MLDNVGIVGGWVMLRNYIVPDYNCKCGIRYRCTRWCIFLSPSAFSPSTSMQYLIVHCVCFCANALIMLGYAYNGAFPFSHSCTYSKYQRYAFTSPFVWVRRDAIVVVFVGTRAADDDLTLCGFITNKPHTHSANIRGPTGEWRRRVNAISDEIPIPYHESANIALCIQLNASGWVFVCGLGELASFVFGSAWELAYVSTLRTFWIRWILLSTLLVY